MIQNKVKDILGEILDLDAKDICIENYLVRDLELESIDYLEIAVEINQKFNTQVVDDIIFLKNLRTIYESYGLEELKKEYPHLEEKRILEIISDFNKGPSIKVSDIIDYIKYYGTN